MYPVNGSAGLTADQNLPQRPPCSGVTAYESSQEPAIAGLASDSSPAGGACCQGAVAAPALAEKTGSQRFFAMRAKQRSIRDDLAASGLLPEGEHTVAGPGGSPMPAGESLRKMRRRARTGATALDYTHTSGGWQVVSIKGGNEEGGVTSHRGVLHPDEYVDEEVLRAAVEAELGFTYDDVHSVFRQGRLSASQGELRAQLDARLLALSRSGANMLELARLLGLAVDEDRGCQTLTRSLRRARAAELSPTEGSTT